MSLARHNRGVWDATWSTRQAPCLAISVHLLLVVRRSRAQLRIQYSSRRSVFLQSLAALERSRAAGQENSDGRAMTLEEEDERMTPRDEAVRCLHESECSGRGARILGFLQVS